MLKQEKNPIFSSLQNIHSSDHSIIYEKLNETNLKYFDHNQNLS